MPETNKEKSHTTQKPYWVDVGSLVVLTITLVGVWYYACEAKRGNDLTERSLEINTRPYIRAIFPEVDKNQPKAGYKFIAHTMLTNLGKVPADVYVRSIAQYSLTKISSPELPVSEHRELVWPSANMNVFVTTETLTDLTEGEVNDIRAGQVGCI